LVSQEIENKVLDYVAKRKGLASENDVIKHIDGYLSRPPTLKLIDKLESEGKISIRRGRKGQRHYLSINDKSRFYQIKNELSSLESLIKENNLYLRRRNEEINIEIENDIPLKENEQKNRATKMDSQIPFVNDLYYNFYDALKRLLDNLFYQITTSDLSKEDSEKFLKKIIELRSQQLKYQPWSKNNEKELLRINIGKINNLIRRFERAGLDEYIEKKQIKNKFAEPLILKINEFIVQFLD
jgi:hypothetical protein